MISICIPTYEQKGEGARYLTLLLQSIRRQKVSCYYEIIISDNATDGSIKAVCDQFRDLPINYFFNPIRGASENINNAIDLAKCDKIKLMCQDDLFLTENAIDQFNKALDKRGWVFSNSKHYNGEGLQTGRRIAKYDHGDFTENKTGMPSVVAFRKCDLRFKPELKTVCDMFFYYQLYEKFGEPGIINDFAIGQRYHNASLSRNQPSNHQRDVNYLIRNKMIPGKLPKVVVAVLVYDREENIKRWQHVWKQCDTEGAELVIIRNGKDRPNIGYDIGAFQDVCRGRIKLDYDYLLWCTDDVIPMSKDFIQQFIDSFGKRVGLVCMHVSNEVQPHVRTTGFCIKKETAQRLEFPADPITTIAQCYQFEHRGKKTLYHQIQNMRLKIVQVAPLPSSPLYDMNYWCRNEQAKKLKDELYRMDEHLKLFVDVQGSEELQSVRVGEPG